MENKLKTGEYASASAFLTDLFTIALNCKTFNALDPKYLGYAESFDEACRIAIDYLFRKLDGKALAE